jgi:hypothetical protein
MTDNVEHIMAVKSVEIVNCDIKKPIELYIIILIIHLVKLRQSGNIRQRINAIVGVPKLISKLQSIPKFHHETKKNIEVNEMLFEVLRLRCAELRATIPGFGSELVARDFPGLLTRTPYDAVLPGGKAKPFDSQRSVIEALRTSDGSPLWILLSSTMGDGKTSMIVSIAKTVEEIVLVVLPGDLFPTVGLHNARYLFHADIPFGFATSKIGGEGQMVYETSVAWMREKKGSGKKRPVKVWVCDPASYIKMQEDLGGNTVTIADEFTKIDDPIALSLVLAHSSKTTILMSATPPLGSFRELEEFARETHGADLVRFRSKYSNIPVTIATMNGIGFVPFKNCKTVFEFRKTIQMMADQVELQKSCTALVTASVYNQIVLVSEELGISLEGLPNFHLESKLEYKDFFRLMFVYLKRIFEICENAPVDENGECPLLIRLCNQMYTVPGIQLDLLSNPDHQRAGMTLVVVDRPEEFFLQCFAESCDAVWTNISPDMAFSQLLRQHTHACLEWDEATARLKKRTESDELLRQKQDELGDRPVFSIIPSLSRKLEGSLKPMPFLFSKIDWNSINCDDRLKCAVMHGIGIISSLEDPSYTDLVLQLANGGQLSFLITPPTFGTGTNFPFTNVIAPYPGTFSSTAVLLQTIGRVGRPGKSDSGNVFLHESYCQEMEDWIMGRIPDTNSIKFSEAIRLARLVPVQDAQIAAFKAEKQQLQEERRQKELLRNAESKARVQAFEKAENDKKLQIAREAEMIRIAEADARREEEMKKMPYRPPIRRDEIVRSSERSGYDPSDVDTRWKKGITSYSSSGGGSDSNWRTPSTQFQQAHTLLASTAQGTSSGSKYFAKSAQSPI